MKPNPETASLQWTLVFQSGVIRDLIATLATCDRTAAIAIVTAIESQLAVEFVRLKDDFPKGIPGEFVAMASLIQRNLVDAKQAIEQAKKPN